MKGYSDALQPNLSNKKLAYAKSSTGILDKGMAVQDFASENQGHTIPVDSNFRMTS